VFTVTGIRVVTADPTSTFSRTFKLRDNAADTAISCVVNHGTTTCNGSGVVSVLTGDLIDVSDTPSSASAATGIPQVSLIGHISSGNPSSLLLTGVSALTSPPLPHIRGFSKKIEDELCADKYRELAHVVMHRVD
jgi:hypothetical protein